MYLPDDPSRFPLQTDFKPRFARHVRYLGVMSYQFVHRLDGQPPIEGQRVDNRMFRISAVQDLRNSKVLRDGASKLSMLASLNWYRPISKSASSAWITGELAGSKRRI